MSEDSFDIGNELKHFCIEDNFNISSDITISLYYNNNMNVSPYSRNMFSSYNSKTTFSVKRKYMKFFLYNTLNDCINNSSYIEFPCGSIRMGVFKNPKVIDIISNELCYYVYKNINYILSVYYKNDVSGLMDLLSLFRYLGKVSRCDIKCI